MEYALAKLGGVLVPLPNKLHVKNLPLLVFVTRRGRKTAKSFLANRPTASDRLTRCEARIEHDLFFTDAPTAAAKKHHVAGLEIIRAVGHDLNARRRAHQKTSECSVKLDRLKSARERVGSGLMNEIETTAENCGDLIGIDASTADTTLGAIPARRMK